MARPIVYGPAGSTYVWSTRLALAEKGVAHDLIEVGFGEHREAPHLSRHPFAKVPAFEHDGFALYETQAILRYIDEGFPVSPLQPTDLHQFARMNQIMGIVDAYAYRPMIWDIVVERTMAPREGRTPDEAKIAAAMPIAEKTLAALSDLMTGPYLLGPQVTLADLHLAPIIAYFRLAPEGQRFLAKAPRIASWWELIAKRLSLQQTRYPLEQRT